MRRHRLQRQLERCAARTDVLEAEMNQLEKDREAAGARIRQIDEVLGPILTMARTVSVKPARAIARRGTPSGVRGTTKEARALAFLQGKEQATLANVAAAIVSSRGATEQTLIRLQGKGTVERCGKGLWRIPPVQT